MVAVEEASDVSVRKGSRRGRQPTIWIKYGRLVWPKRVAFGRRWRPPKN